MTCSEPLWQGLTVKSWQGVCLRHVLTEATRVTETPCDLQTEDPMGPGAFTPISPSTAWDLGPEGRVTRKRPQGILWTSLSEEVMDE